MGIYIASFGALLFTFAVTWLLLRKLIPILKSHKIGQKINELGPRWHKSKEGTPIMGGICFIIPCTAVIITATAVSVVKGSFSAWLPVLLSFIMALCNGMIGFFDDYTKLIKKQNEGFKPWQKLVLQFLVNTLYVSGMALCGAVDTKLEIPFCGAEVELGFFYYIFSVLLISGIVNAVNLTDGVDGLASSVTGVVGIFFCAAGIAITRSTGLALLGAITVGGCAGFLMYNFYPAQIFMGDTGSLFLGGMVMAMAYAANEPLIVIICGIIYIIEVLSDIIQVTYFKATHGKRFFKCAPIHHHLEKSGWCEVEIVAVFAAVTLLFCIAAWFGLKLN